MRISRIAMVGVFFIGLALVAPVNADFVVFKVPTTNISLVLQGKATQHRDKHITLVHVSKQTFDLPALPGVEKIDSKLPKEMAIEKLSSAKGKEEELAAAVSWALDHGLIPEFHRALDQLVQANAAHPFGARAKQLKDELSKPLPDDPQAEAALLKLHNGADARVVKSAHFVLLAPPVVPEKGAVKRKKPEARLEQLEQLLEVFVMKCAERGLPVHAPTAKMQVALIASPPSSNDVGLRTRPRDATVHWSPSQDVLFINDGAKIATLEPVKKLLDKVNESALLSPSKRRGDNPGAGGQPGAGAPGMMSGGAGGPSANFTLDSLKLMKTPDLQKMATTLQSLMIIGVENFELEPISREAAYLFTNNCGVLPKSAPLWLRDGLATYFEMPAEMGWIRIGEIGHVRQAWYQASLQDPERITVTDIVCGHLHQPPLSPNDIMRATTQSWALVHFLLQQHSDGIPKFLAGLRSLPPDIQIPDDVTMGIFDEAFGAERSKLEEEWREHMTALKPEYQSISSDGASEPSTAQNSK